MPAATLNPMHPEIFGPATPTPHPTAGQGIEAAQDSAEQLAARCRDGSIEPYEKLVEQFETRIFRFLTQYVGNSHDAEDLTQETFVRAWRNIHRFDPKRDFATWLFVIARRAAANHFRARKIHELLPEEIPAAGAQPSDSAEAQDQSTALWRAARKLKPRYYEALWFRYVEDFSVIETARVMGLTVLHVKVILHRARNELARHLKREDL
jgi:RNA polymerase sigma-70 factor (ECF subfamily)